MTKFKPVVFYSGKHIKQDGNKLHIIASCGGITDRGILNNKTLFNEN